MIGYQTIPAILQIAEVSEYLAVVDIAQNNMLQGGDISENQARLIYIERVGIQNRYNLNPSDPSLQGTANYLLSICRYWTPRAVTIINNLRGGKAAITGPANQSVTVGNTATFTVSVASSTPYVVQWFLNNVLIPGATSLTYSVTNAQLSQSGNLYSVRVTNSAGVISSNQATLTVTASILGYLYYSASDPGPTLQASSDPFSYQNNYPIVHNTPITVTLPSAASPNLFLVFKVPSTESAKTTWFNTPLNNGNFPDSVFQTPLTFGGWTYYYSRVACTMDTTQTFVLS